MAAPVLARVDDAGDRFYTWKGETFWSVTTLIDGGVPKYGLPGWYARTTAELAFADIDARGTYARARAALRRWAKAGRLELTRIQADGGLTSIDAAKLTDRDYALRWLVGEPVRLRDLAGETGSAVHDEAEAVVLRRTLDSAEAYATGLDLPAWPAPLAGYGVSFANFLEDWRPIYLATEASVFNRSQAYAGTLDAIIRVEIASGEWLVLCVDYKSGKRIYPEVGMQTSAYRRGEFIGLADRVTELPLPPTDGAAVLHLKPGPTRGSPRGYSFRLVRSDDDVFKAFLFAREVFRWSKDTARTIIGAGLVPPTREELQHEHQG